MKNVFPPNMNLFVASALDGKQVKAAKRKMRREWLPPQRDASHSFSEKGKCQQLAKGLFSISLITKHERRLYYSL